MAAFDPAANRDRLVLVGLPGSGKSTVGPVVATRLGWRFHDVDTEIEEYTGCSIADLFRTDGETAFRAMEFRLTVELCSLPDVVVAPGGGWAAQPGALEALPPSAAVVWLRIPPVEAIRRLRGNPVRRPLLDVADVDAAMHALAAGRTPAYQRAHYVVDVVGRSVPEISDAICAWLRPGTS